MARALYAASTHARTRAREQKERAGHGLGFRQKSHPSECCHSAASGRRFLGSASLSALHRRHPSAVASRGRGQ
eukprot:6364231-Alexandrium_andersonii.AAC.1